MTFYHTSVKLKQGTEHKEVFLTDAAAMSWVCSFKEDDQLMTFMIDRNDKAPENKLLAA